MIGHWWKISHILSSITTFETYHITNKVCGKAMHIRNITHKTYTNCISLVSHEENCQPSKIKFSTVAFFLWLAVALLEIDPKTSNSESWLWAHTEAASLGEFFKEVFGGRPDWMLLKHSFAKKRSLLHYFATSVFAISMCWFLTCFACGGGISPQAGLALFLSICRCQGNASFTCQSSGYSFFRLSDGYSLRQCFCRYPGTKDHPGDAYCDSTASFLSRTYIGLPTHLSHICTNSLIVRLLEVAVCIQ